MNISKPITRNTVRENIKEQVSAVYVSEALEMLRREIVLLHYKVALLENKTRHHDNIRIPYGDDPPTGD